MRSQGCLNCLYWLFPCTVITQRKKNYEILLFENCWKSPNNSPILMPFLVAFEEYVGPIPFFVVPNPAPFLLFSCSCRPSTCWWKSNTKWALSDMINLSCQFLRPFFSFFSSSSNKPGKCITTPFPAMKKKIRSWSRFRIQITFLYIILII